MIDSQLAFAKRATRWEQDTLTNRKMAFTHYFGPNGKSPSLEVDEPDPRRAPRAEAARAGDDGDWVSHDVQRFLYAIDGISTFFGKAAAWLIIVLMSVVCIEVVKRYALNAPTAWIFDVKNMLYGIAVHAGRRLYAGAKCPCPGRLSLQLDAAAHPGELRPCSLSRVLRPRHRGADLFGRPIMPPIPGASTSTRM